MLGFGTLMLVAGLALAVGGFSLDMNNRPVVCCYTDMLTTPKLSVALDDLSVTDKQLVQLLAKRDKRIVSAKAPEQSRDQMTFLLAQQFAPDARDLYIERYIEPPSLGWQAAVSRVQAVCGSCRARVG